MTSPPYTGAGFLASVAKRIADVAPHKADGFGPLIVLTDPLRLPDPIALATYLPTGCTLIYRHFGAPNAKEISAKASNICQNRGLIFLISCDNNVRPGPHDGVHFPEHMHAHIAEWRTIMPDSVFTAAAHSKTAALAVLAAGANAVLLSPVFDTKCDGANAALGPEGFARIAKAVPGPVFALGGINVENAKELSGHAAGLAVISAVLL
jgi:thiamine-phosphate pyrophosphorylase